MIIFSLSLFLCLWNFCFRLNRVLILCQIDLMFRILVSMIFFRCFDSSLSGERERVLAQSVLYCWCSFFFWTHLFIVCVCCLFDVREIEYVCRLAGWFIRSLVFFLPLLFISSVFVCWISIFFFSSLFFGCVSLLFAHVMLSFVGSKQYNKNISIAVGLSNHDEQKLTCVRTLNCLFSHCTHMFSFLMKCSNALAKYVCRWFFSFFSFAFFLLYFNGSVTNSSMQRCTHNSAIIICNSNPIRINAVTFCWPDLKRLDA